MSLLIEELRSTCRLPRDLAAEGSRLGDTARHDLPQELARQLAGRLPTDGVVRVRDLPVKVELSRAELAAGGLPSRWAAAVVAALERALAGGQGGGVEVVWAENRAAWVARVLGDLLAGTVVGRWEYGEFAAVLEKPSRDAALALLLDEPRELPAVLRELEGRKQLERWLRLFDELARERLVRAVAESSATSQKPLTLAELPLVAWAALDLAVPGTWWADRCLALRLFARATPGEVATWASSPRRILQLLTVLDELARVPRAAWADQIAARTVAERHPDLSQAVVTLLAEIRRRVTAPSTGSSAELDRLEPILQARQGNLPGRPTITMMKTLHSDFAGFFLLVGVLERLGWPQLLTRSELALAWGPRLLPHVLCAVALSLTRRFSTEPTRLDSGLALFAGFGFEPDLAGLRRFFAMASAAERALLLKALEIDSRACDSWEHTAEALAAALCRALASRVRGFKRSSPDFIRRHFLALPGRLEIDEETLAVHLAPQPYHVALRMAGLDEAWPTVSWLGDRTLTVHFEGL